MSHCRQWAHWKGHRRSSGWVRAREECWVRPEPDTQSLSYNRTCNNCQTPQASCASHSRAWEWELWQIRVQWDTKLKWSTKGGHENHTNVTNAGKIFLKNIWQLAGVHSGPAARGKTSVWLGCYWKSFLFPVKSCKRALTLRPRQRREVLFATQTATRSKGSLG